MAFVGDAGVSDENVDGAVVGSGALDASLNG